MASASTCCQPWKRQCQKLRIVIATTAPWGPPVGGPPTPPTITTPNAPPQSGLAALGLPGPVKLSGTPVAIPAPVASLPPDLLATYGSSNLAVLAFDFGMAAFATGTATGTVIARGVKNCTQASMQFNYNWCGNQRSSACAPDFRWSTEKCTRNGMQFYVLDATTWISNNPCLDSVVVLGLQQYCCTDGAACAVSPCTQAALPCVTQRVSTACAGSEPV